MKCQKFGDENYSVHLFIQFFTWWRSIRKLLFLHQKQNYVVSLRTTSHEAKFPSSPCLQYRGWKTQVCGLAITYMCQGVRIPLVHKITEVMQPMSLDEESALGSITPTGALAAQPALSCIWAPTAAIWAPKTPNHDPFRTLLHVAKLLIPQSMWPLLPDAKLPSGFWTLKELHWQGPLGHALKTVSFLSYKKIPLTCTSNRANGFAIRNPYSLLDFSCDLWHESEVVSMTIGTEWNLNWTTNLATLVAYPHWTERAAG